MDKQFNIDKQSLDELNLLSKFSPGSVFFLFRKAKSSGGEQLLDEWFRNPLLNHGEINERSALFAFFGAAGITFPFDPQQLSVMNDYIDSGVPATYFGNYTRVMIQLITSRITRDEQFKQLVQGLQAVISTLKKCYALLVALKQMKAIPDFYKGRIKKLLQIFDHVQVAELLETDIYKSISLKTIASYDYLTRHVLRAEVIALLGFIDEVDVCIAIANVAKTKEMAYATAYPAEMNLFTAVNLCHPAINGAVGNNIEMRSASNVVFLTGANMAGKSTWMKSIAINMYLAHIGFPIAAQSMEFSIRDGIYSSINVGDNIGAGYSHFYAEVLRVKQAAEATASGKRLLLIFDELFKGTNVKDAYDGTLAVTEAFAEYKNCLFIVSTHIIEVGEALKTQPNIQFKYMPTIMEGAIPRYTYQLEEGITEDRQGMMIIRNENILSLMGMADQ
ncbi:MutS-related protein [Mucilaginibacter auburnensis]|uniref:MutS-like protein n=1 Tax=Mucilaginibacter auburnensis TaxID=1457233 RepID=A0A2H9VW30_9SPHI|nr:DNA mismatch repair protein [Mucilaginibacter auburnensis]PJJ85026.1 MutS-like protein [Mucilaginibacter auburnensis]